MMDNLIDGILICLEDMLYFFIGLFKVVFTIIGLVLFLVLCPIGFTTWLQYYSEHNF